MGPPPESSHLALVLDRNEEVPKSAVLGAQILRVWRTWAKLRRLYAQRREATPSSYSASRTLGWVWMGYHQSPLIQSATLTGAERTYWRPPA